MQPQQQRPSSGLGAITPLASPELSKWILDPAEIMGNLEIWFKGAKIVRDAEGRPFVTEGNSEVLNEKGRQFVLSYLYTHLQKNIVLSDLDERQIGDIAEDSYIHIVTNLALNYREYGISDPYKIPLIADQININVFAALNRAKKGAAWKGLKELTVITESITKQPTQSQGGILSGFLGGNKGGSQ